MVLLSEFLAQRTADILPGLALLLTVFNELVRLKQRRGADLAAEKADALIPCQQLEHVVQRGTLHLSLIHICAGVPLPDAAFRLKNSRLEQLGEDFLIESEVEYPCSQESWRKSAQ